MQKLFKNHNGAIHRRSRRRRKREYTESVGGFFFFSNFVSFYLCIKSIGGFVVKFVVFGYAKEISAFLAGVETWFLR